MKPGFPLWLAPAYFLFPLSAQAASYSLHGTYLDYGTLKPGLSSFPAPRRVPAVLYVSMKGRRARVQLQADGARCVPELGASTFVGASAGNARAVSIYLEQKSECFHNAPSARLEIEFRSPSLRGVSRAVLTDRGRGGAALFVAE